MIDINRSDNCKQEMIDTMVDKIYNMETRVKDLISALEEYYYDSNLIEIIIHLDNIDLFAIWLCNERNINNFDINTDILQYGSTQRRRIICM